MPAIFIFRQLPKSPRRHSRHVLSWPPCQPTPTRCPTVHSATPAPTSSTTPATSWPGTRGYSIPGKAPSFVSTSLWQTPQACTLIRTCPAPGFGVSRSTISKSAPAFGTTATFIGAAATLVDSILPPIRLRPLVNGAVFVCRGDRPVLVGPLPGHLENELQLDRSTERQACDADHQATRIL